MTIQPGRDFDPTHSPDNPNLRMAMDNLARAMRHFDPNGNVYITRQLQMDLQLAQTYAAVSSAQSLDRIATQLERLAPGD